jgi:hypothetical protein
MYTYNVTLDPRPVFKLTKGQLSALHGVPLPGLAHLTRRPRPEFPCWKREAWFYPKVAILKCYFSSYPKVLLFYAKVLLDSYHVVATWIHTWMTRVVSATCIDSPCELISKNDF